MQYQALVQNQQPYVQPCQNNYKQGQQRQRSPERKLDLIPITCSQLLNYLLNGSLVKLRGARPPPMPLPPGYDVNARCEFHYSAPGHSINNCKAFRYKVEYLLESKTIFFTPVGPNVNNIPMPPHACPPVSVIGVSEGKNLVARVDQMKTALAVVKEHLLKNGVFPDFQSDCDQCLLDPHICEKLKSGVQHSLNEGTFVLKQVLPEEDVATLEITSYPI